MKQKLYTLAIAHLDGPAAEIFTSKQAALARRLEFAEVTTATRLRILNLFDSGTTSAYEEELNQLKSNVSRVCSIEEHDL